MKLDGKWIWAGEEHPNAYCYLRREFDTGDAVVAATLRITADTSYYVYVNGQDMSGTPNFVQEAAIAPLSGRRPPLRQGFSFSLRNASVCAQASFAALGW